MAEPDQFKFIKQECLRLLSRREHSRKEIEQKLVNKGFSSDVILAVLNELRGKDWQSDSRFAESYARQRSLKGFGPLRIKFELIQKGIETSTIQQQTQLVDYDWMTELNRICAKKFSNLATMSHSERARCKRFLLQRGFSGEMINAYFKQISQPN